MKQNLKNTPIKATLTLAILAILGTGVVDAQITGLKVDNHSFEEPYPDPVEPELDIDPAAGIPGWTPYEIFPPYFHVGTLSANYPGSTWFNQSIVGQGSSVFDGNIEGSRVLFLYNGSGSAGGVSYGVEQTMEAEVQQNRSYTLSVKVGNPFTSDTSTGGNYQLEGMPLYRVQLYAGDTLIGEDFASKEIPEGEVRPAKFQTADFTGTDLIGEPLTIRLINENNLTKEADVLGQDIEVDFDHVELWETVTSGAPSKLTWSTQLIEKINSDSGGETVDLQFSISGKGKRRLLFVGQGTSLHDRISNLAKDPTLTIYRNEKAVGVSDNWRYEKQADEIKATLKKADLQTAASDSAVILELEAGEYYASVSANRETDVYAGIKIYDLNAKSENTTLELSEGGSNREFKRLWSGK